MSNKLRHQILGVFVLFFLVVYLCVLGTGDIHRWRTIADTSLRLSILLGVVWLAWDDLLCIPKWLCVFAPIVILAIVVFPKIAPYVILVLVPLWLLLKFLRYLGQPLPPQKGKRK